LTHTHLDRMCRLVRVDGEDPVAVIDHCGVAGDLLVRRDLVRRVMEANSRAAPDLASSSWA
jgi:hypothetical protein